MDDSFPRLMFARASELRGSGMEWLHASGIAWLEERIRQWPVSWGDDLHVLIYGDFLNPESELHYPSLGITVHAKRQEGTVIRGATTVLESTVKIPTKTVASLVDAARRLNLLLGAYTLHEWGNSGWGWWSWVTHGTIGGAMARLTHANVEASTEAICNLPDKVRRKVEAAMFWVRDPRGLVLESYRSDVLRVYAAYWNAFECLVEAVDLLRPRSGATRTERQEHIDSFVQSRGGRLTAADVQHCYQTIVNPGFVGKASHALQVCFPDQADMYIEECFRVLPERERLYNIRNAINHGEIDAEDPVELIRVDARVRRLWMIVWRIFGRLVPFPAPVDDPSHKR